MGDINLNNLQQTFVSKLGEICTPSSKGGEKITSEELTQLEQVAINDDEKAFIQKLKDEKKISVQIDSNNDGKADSVLAFEFVDDAVVPAETKDSKQVQAPEIKEENKVSDQTAPVLRPLNIRPWNGYEPKESYTPVADFQTTFPGAKGSIPVLSNADAKKFMEKCLPLFAAFEVKDLQKLIGAKIDNKVGPETFLKVQEQTADLINNVSKADDPLAQAKRISSFLTDMEAAFPGLASNPRHQELKQTAMQKIEELTPKPAPQVDPKQEAVKQFQQIQDNFNKASTLEDYQAIDANLTQFEAAFANILNNNPDMKASLDSLKASVAQKIKELTPKPEPQEDPKLKEAAAQYKQITEAFNKASKLEDYQAIKGAITKFETDFPELIKSNAELKGALETLKAEVEKKITELTPPPVPEKAGKIIELLSNNVTGKKGEQISSIEKPLVAKLLKDASAEDIAFLAKNLDQKAKQELYNLYSKDQSWLTKRGDNKLQGRLTALAYLSGDASKVKTMLAPTNAGWAGWSDYCDDIAREALKIITDEKVNKMDVGKATLPMKQELLKALEADNDKENREMAVKVLQQSSQQEFVKLANAFKIKDMGDLKDILNAAGHKGKNVVDIFGFDPAQLVW